TVESVGRLLDRNPRGLLLARDELDAWFQGFTRYRAGGATDRPHWLEMHRAGHLAIDRCNKDAPRLFIRRAAVSIVGTIQLEVFQQALNPTALAAGLGARFLTTLPPHQKRTWHEADIPEELTERYRQLVLALLALDFADPAKHRPCVLQLS